MCAESDSKADGGPWAIYCASAISKLVIPKDEALLIAQAGWITEDEKHLYWRAQEILRTANATIQRKWLAQALRNEADRIEGKAHG